MRILMLSSTFPYPPSRGGTEIRTFNLLKYLQQNHSVTLVTQQHEGVSATEVEELRKYVSELIVFPLPPEIPKKKAGAQIFGKIRRFAESVIKATPANVLHRYSPEIQTLVDNYIQGQKFDVITCEHSVNEIYIRPEFRQNINTVVDIHSSVYSWTNDHLKMGASQNPLRDRLYLAFILERYEKRYCNKFSHIVVTTEDDRQEFLKLRPEMEIQVIPNGVDLELFPYRDQDPGGHKLIFVGAMDASHNIDAARFFALEVLPELQKTYADATFSIVGARPTPEILALKNIPGVIVTGRIPSMVEYLHQSTVCVVPLRTGFGIKNKTLEAMAAGVPVVASDRGLEGLAIEQPISALRANKPAEYVAAISQLFDSPQLRDQLSHNGRQLVETEFTWAIAGKRYEQVCLGLNHQG
ncbi:glycosyltransferase family 4 protein [Nodularia spumigena]|uniref:glycosyltransferase family 4 protein n=1 Tax=Nodularia spumigena TaxID=70799 RepID=UPI00232A9134|nr:glycosyltransferase family 4 protein [Nodularia spumigena]MDB9316950.1 glycosyltransferase family 4 protein [Nodularia spumigena CS-590/01A]MDB9324593.1 glycosyltransferase family 4 protein [Nodularia spumigena CS-590/02]MDB9337393.1 glycosyltransferase family 4 protein [Nodularia spumigena CS-590/01]